MLPRNDAAESGFNSSFDIFSKRFFFWIRKTLTAAVPFGVAFVRQDN
jgi:hypothetical protein